MFDSRHKTVHQREMRKAEYGEECSSYLRVSAPDFSSTYLVWRRAGKKDLKQRNEAPSMSSYS